MSAVTRGVALRTALSLKERSYSHSPRCSAGWAWPALASAFAAAPLEIAGRLLDKRERAHLVVLLEPLRRYGILVPAGPRATGKRKVVQLARSRSPTMLGILLVHDEIESFTSLGVLKEVAQASAQHIAHVDRGCT